MIVGLEVELHSNRYNIYEISKREGLNFETFKKKDGLNIKMSIEYYPHTIEYNFEPHILTKAYLKKISKYIKGQMDKYGLVIYNKSPSFVGTHVHIFDLKYRKLKGEELLKTSMYYIDKSFGSLYDNSKRRLALSHQLWGNYVYNNFSDYHDICGESGLSMAYVSMNAERPKYNPLLVSNRSDKGKPRSVEIRIIPNEFLFNDNLYDLLFAIKKERYEDVSVNDMLADWVYQVSRLR